MNGNRQPNRDAVHNQNTKNRQILFGACIFVIASSATTAVKAQVQNEQSATVVYEVSFFDQYNPITALDLVLRVPGFTIDSGDEVRGFGGSAGNILINGERPSTKSDGIEDLLGRISRNNVERIELIRGATGGLDLGAGQSVVVNVILKADASGSGTYSVTLVERRGRYEPRLNVSYNDNMGATNYTIGIERFGFDIVRNGVETLQNFAGPDELRIEDETGGFDEWTLDLKTETSFKNGDVFRLNFQGETGLFSIVENSFRTPDTQAEANLFLRGFEEDEDEFEVSSDYEHSFSNSFQMKVIGLLNRTFRDEASSLDIQLTDGTGGLSRSFTETTEGETIGRLEFDWAAAPEHTVQFGAEVARNFIDSEFQLFVGDVEIQVPGANTRVSEIRGEIFASDSWTLSQKLTLDLGLNIEASEISQSGDVENARSFLFTKPSASLTYVQNPKTQWRLQLVREVGQLNFGDFVSTANFQDDDLDLGNPELQPDSTWVARATYERRFGSIGVIELTAFYNYIQDVIDLLPLGPTTESPGNIGNGERWGIEANFTTDFNFINLANTRVDVSYRLQDSSVTDLVTGLDRQLSNERPQQIEVIFRKEFPSIRSTFGFEYFNNRRQIGFGVDELDVEGRFLRTNFFWETTFAAGIKTRLEVRDAFNQRRLRERKIFAGSRADADISFIETRRRSNNTELFVTVSGIF